MRAPVDCAEAAWALAGLGWPVFPCVPGGKEPMTAHGCKDATTDRHQLAAWWDRWPRANVAVATGALVVVDVDGRAGDAALARFGPMPATVTAVTGKGRHLYFAAPAGLVLGNTARRLGPELDTRGAGGYVVAPPSLHPDGYRYAWAPSRSPWDLAPAALPDALTAALTAPPAPCAPSAGRDRAPGALDGIAAGLRGLAAWLDTIPTGLRDGEGRNDLAYRIAARCLEDLTAADALDVLDAWNRENAEPLPVATLRRVLANADAHSRTAKRRRAFSGFAA